MGKDHREYRSIIPGAVLMISFVVTLAIIYADSLSSIWGGLKSSSLAGVLAALSTLVVTNYAGGYLCGEITVCGLNLWNKKCLWCLRRRMCMWCMMCLLCLLRKIRLDCSCCCKCSIYKCCKSCLLNLRCKKHPTEQLRHILKLPGWMPDDLVWRDAQWFFRSKDPRYQQLELFVTRRLTAMFTSLNSVVAIVFGIAAAVAIAYVNTGVITPRFQNDRWMLPVGITLLLSFVVLLCNAHRAWTEQWVVFLKAIKEFKRNDSKTTELNPGGKAAE